MNLPDVNVLVYAYRQDAPLHQIARAWLDDAVTGESRFAISKLALSAFIRIATNPRAHKIPTPAAAAFEFCDNLLGQPNCEIVEPGEGHWEIFRRMCAVTNMRGNDVTDAWYAALAIEWGCEWVTFDRDFLKFPELNCKLLASPAA